MNFNHRKIRNFIRIGVALCTAIVLILASTINAKGATTYTVIDIGVLDSSSSTSSSYANDINNKGQVVGYSSTLNGDRAFLWDSSNGMQDLGVLGSFNSLTNSRANDINNKGQVVGFSTQSNPTRSAFLWDKVNGMQDLGTMSTPSPSGRSAYGINNKSQVVGGANAPTTNRNDPAFIWDSINGMQPLEFSPAYFNIANDINDSGQIVGYVNLRYRPSFAALWDSTTRKITNLNNSIDPNSGWSLVEARAINNKGEIVGYGTYNNQTRAFLLQPTNMTASKPGGLIQRG
ncbi:DUF3466 family protein [Scytonema sp. UIC 10036]|uniref:DUF3466 family protein n=1 Tax=Scytonema sp. UIC 10036 TaxID=2304196 RepID=UPI00140F9C83|nr:DUF3466 family protein [Scytonema sp. UIC 10036]